MDDERALRAWAEAYTRSGSSARRTPQLFMRQLLGRTARGTVAVGMIAISVTLSGCGTGGFQPLYATGATGERTDARLAELDFAPIPGRVGQRIRNELVFERSAGGQAAAPTKRVEIKLTESVLTNGVQVTGDSTSQTYQIEAVYRIVNIASGKVEGEGRSVARANFERFQAVYSNVRARDDAENRAARVISGDLKTRLAVHLSRG